MQPEALREPGRFASVAAVEAELRSLTDDPLASGGTNMVVYRGNVSADVMLIGEGPGAEEDRLGEPFVGRSGQLLDKILSAAGFDPRLDVFVTNAVFRRPPGNRKPTAEELAFYRPWLIELVRLVDPMVILLVGGVAVQAVLAEKRGITQLRGKWIDWAGRRVMPVFHPAYLLRNPSRAPGSPKALMWQDILAVRDAVKADDRDDRQGQALPI